MKIITVFNEKGGVGKTTFTGLIGAGLAQRGQRVLLLDADGQGDLTKNMKLAKTSNFYDFVRRGNPAEENFVSTKTLIVKAGEGHPDNLYIVRGNNETWAIPLSMKLTSIISNISRRLHSMEDAFDFVLIDTQPSGTTLHDAIGLISDWVICPTDCEPLSAYGGLRETVNHMNSIREQSLNNGRDKCRIMGIIPNKYRATTALHKHVYSTLLDEYGALVWEPIPLRTNIPEAQLLRATIMHDAPELETNAIIWSMIDRVEAAMKEVELG